MMRNSYFERLNEIIVTQDKTQNIKQLNFHENKNKTKFKVERPKLCTNDNHIKTIDSNYFPSYPNGVIINDGIDYLSSIHVDKRVKSYNNSIKLENHIRMMNQPIINQRIRKAFDNKESKNHHHKNSDKENQITSKTLKNLKSEIIDRVNIKYENHKL